MHIRRKIGKLVGAILCCAMLAGFASTIAHAEGEDTRTVVTTIKASTTTAFEKPTYGSEKKNYDFAVTEKEPNEANVRIADGMKGWQRKPVGEGSWSDYSDGTFQGGEYRYYIQVRAEGTYRLSADTKVWINGEEWKISEGGEPGGNEAMSFMTYYSPAYTATAEELTDVRVTVTEPVAGEHPDYTVTAAEPDKYEAEVTSWVDWYAESNRTLTPESVFEAGKRYVVYVKMRPKPGYVFSTASEEIYKINGETTGSSSTGGPWLDIAFRIRGFTAVDSGHTHVYDQKLQVPEALKRAADCTHNAVYYMSCACGKHGTAGTFEAEESMLGHDWSTDWKTDENKHWHECRRCHIKKEEGLHTASPSDSTKCGICDHAMDTVTLHGLIKEAKVTVTAPVVGQHPVFTATKASGNYRIAGTVTWSDIAAPGIELDASYKFLAGHTYAATVNLQADSGYEFASDAVYQVNEKEIGAEGTSADEKKLTVWLFASCVTHRYDQEIKREETFIAWADCNNAERYYKSCICGAVSPTETFTVGTALGHDYGTEWSMDSDGHWHLCRRCHTAKAGEAAHSAGGWITDTAATESTDGTRHKECTICGYVMESGIIPATGSGIHTHSYSNRIIAPTCTADGYTEHRCACGYTYRDTYVKKTGHTDRNNDGKCDICGSEIEKQASDHSGGSGNSGSSGLSSGSTSGTPAIAAAPSTGDNAPLIQWFLTLLLAGGVLGSGVAYRRKKR